MDQTTLEAERIYRFEKYVLEWYEYIVFGVILTASMGIGIFFGCFGGRNKTNEEFLMAGRSMSILPVALSLTCSFVSAITLLGYPVEVYFYGTQITLIALSFVPMTALLAYLYVPVYFELHLTSAYEYFEWRFSRKVRFLMSAFALIHLMVYMPITVWGPSLALEQVAGINAYSSAAVMFLVCIAYSSIGGLKAVLWTDAIQATVMVGALSSVVGFGIHAVGGIEYIWAAAERTDRVQWFNFDPDLRTRHTFWTATVGGLLMWLPIFAATQAQVQRYNSVPTLRDSRICLVLNMFGMIFFYIVCSFVIGLMIYAQYATCDPVSSKRVTSADQLLPLFVMDVLKKYPGVPGFLVAGLTCASLSTVSSGLNSLTAILIEDYIKLFRPGMDDFKLGCLSKIVSTISGLISFAFIFIVAFVNKTIQISPFSQLLHGSLLGPILSTFTLGMFFPWANDTGIIIGIFASVIVTGTFCLGSILAGNAGILPNQRLNLTTNGCNATTLPDISFFTENHQGQFLTTEPSVEWKNEDYSFDIRLWSISYFWQPGVGIFSMLIFGLLFSVLVIAINPKSIPKVNKSLLSKPFLRLWTHCFGQNHLDKWVDYDAPHYGLRNDQKRNPANWASPSELEINMDVRNFDAKKKNAGEAGKGDVPDILSAPG